MNVRIRNLLIAGLLLGGLNLIAQHRLNNVENENEFGFDPQQWIKIENRWLGSQTIALVYTGKENYTAGQLVHVDEDALFIYPRKGLPVGPEWYNNMMRIPMNEVDSILLQKGGNKALREKRAISYTFPTPISKDQKEFHKIKQTAVFSDTLTDFKGLDVAFKNSRLMRLAFPKKHVRFNFAVSFGPDVIVKDMEDMLKTSSLPSPDDGWNQIFRMEILDISVRIYDRFLIGGQFIPQNISSSLNGSMYGTAMDMGYYYHIDLTENRLYAEYALINVDRYFTRSYEVLLGAGLLLSNSDWNFSYNYTNYTDLENITGDYIYTNREYRFRGTQIRSSFHYYFFPGFSLFAGLEANLYPSFSVLSLEVPSPELGETKFIPEHKLNFSSVRFRFGVSLYL